MKLNMWHLWICCFVTITTSESKSDVPILLAKVLGGVEVDFVLGLKIQQIQVSVHKCWKKKECRSDIGMNTGVLIEVWLPALLILAEVETVFLHSHSYSCSLDSQE